MSDPLNGIKPTLPTWPVVPVKPATKDREPGDRKNEPRRRETDADDDEPKSTIDEYI